jgi:xylulokinase
MTGSIATERFAGPQIRKFWKENPEGYNQTAHIALISSFVTSLFIGQVAPVDAGDGFGTNLADIHTGQWSETALAATAPDLEERLPQLIIQDEVVGKIAWHMVERYGFDPQTSIIVGSGDNPCSLVGLGLIGESDTVAISLGTSDTYFGYIPQLLEEERSTGHIFGTADGNYMFLICFKNGSLAREHVKNSYGLSWDEFSRILMETSPGNGGRIMLPYFLPEITPLVLESKVHRLGGLSEEDKVSNVRAIAEAQIMAMYLHSGWIGCRPKSILVTAGGSENRGLLRVISQVFGAEVRSYEVKESAALGAAIRAAYCCLKEKNTPVEWKDLTDPFIKDSTAEVIHPSAEDAEIYQGENGLLSIYEACEKFALDKGQNPQEKIEKFKTKFLI